MTHPEPQAAPPETDLRAMSDKELVRRFGSAERSYGYESVMRGKADPSLGVVLEAELKRRLARPDALRAKVMAAIDEGFCYDENEWPDVEKAVKHAVAAVLEGE
jgi:hypothetical protein